MAKDVDHITPKAQGGTDDLENLQSLCTECHKAKTQAENRAGWMPDALIWPVFEEPACETILVTGPPLAGKSYYCRAKARPGDVVIDLDEIASDGKHGGRSAQVLKRALAARNEMLTDLAKKHSGRAFVIVSAATPEEQEWWRVALGARHVRLDTDKGVLRSAAPDRRLAYDRYCAKAKKPFAKGRARETCEVGEDGWPICQKN